MQPVDTRSVIKERPLADFCCQNVRCVLYGQKGQGNIGPKGWSSKTQNIRTLICNTCGKRFSERKGTALYQMRMPMEKALGVLQHLQDHGGIRQTARLIGVSKDSVNRLAKMAGEHADKALASNYNSNSDGWLVESGSVRRNE